MNVTVDVVDRWQPVTISGVFGVVEMTLGYPVSLRMYHFWHYNERPKFTPLCEVIPELDKMQQDTLLNPSRVRWYDSYGNERLL